MFVYNNGSRKSIDPIQGRCIYYYVGITFSTIAQAICGVCTCAFDLFISNVFRRHYFNELIYRFLVNNNRRVRDGGGGVYTFIILLYIRCARLARGEEKNGLLIFVVLNRGRPPTIIRLCLPCASLPLPRRRIRHHTNLHARFSIFCHNRPHRHRRCATETPVMIYIRLFFF